MRFAWPSPRGLLSLAQLPWEPRRDTVIGEPCLRGHSFPPGLSPTASSTFSQEHEKVPARCTQLTPSGGCHGATASSRLWCVPIPAQSQAFPSGASVLRGGKGGTEWPQSHQMLTGPSHSYSRAKEWQDLKVYWTEPF